MPFFQVDDQFHLNRKAEALIDMGQVGLAAAGLWTLVGSKIQAGTPTDGQVADTAWRLIGDKRLFTKLAKLLVQVGLWEERDYGWEYHDWFDVGYTSGAKVNLNRKRTKEMKNPDVVEAVKARDGDKCRYCARAVKWSDRSSDAGATYDHVIPGIAAGVQNLVVACRKCNRQKGQRTPEQAKMTLLPPPHGPDAPGAEPAGPGPEAGPGPGPGPAPDQVPDQLGEQLSATPLRNRSRTGDGLGPGAGEAPVVDEVNAGQPPDIPPPATHTGSPYFNWHGPPDDQTDIRCPEHNKRLPCSTCTATHYREESTR